MRGVLAEISPSAIRHNYHLLNERAYPAQTMAVIKADAYGHGLACVVPALLAEGCCQFAVTDAAEGVKLRLLLQQQQAEAEITLLAGIADSEDAGQCQSHGLSPVLLHQKQVDLLVQHDFSGRVWIKIDTGMSRTGAQDPLALYQYCKHQQIPVAGILSHLSCADTPSHPLNAKQVDAFAHWRKKLPDVSASLLNSAGLISMPQQALDVARPGIALYGVEACAGFNLGLQAVMRLSAPIIQINIVKAGDRVGYGGSFSAKQEMRVAVVAAGYADGIPRVLSNCGHVRFQQQRLPVLGRVCMDYCMVDASASTAAEGDRVAFWDNQLTASSVAQTAQTISYELFTRVGPRVPRQCNEWQQ